MKRIIVTAADESFSDLLIDLLESLWQWKQPLAETIGVLDLGLSAKTLDRVRSRAHQIVVPKWDLNVDERIAAEKPHLRAITSRPFLRDYFPGHDSYLWLDADTWVQNAFAVELLFNAAAQGIGLVPQVHPSYTHRPGAVAWRLTRLKSYFPDDGVMNYQNNTYFNAGVFSLAANSPLWAHWGRYFQLGLSRSSNFVDDQTALNYAIWKEGLSCQALPALCNWCCHLAAPLLNRATLKFHEPCEPRRELGIIHMTAKTKDARWSLPNRAQRMGFRFRDIRHLQEELYFNPLHGGQA